MIQLAVSVLLVTASAVALRCEEAPQSSAAPAPQSKAVSAAYPTYEPFRASRMFDAFFEDVDALDLEAALKDVEAVIEIRKVSKRAAGGDPAEADATGPRALLLPALDDKTRSTYTVLPVALMKLEPLWKNKTWSAEQLATAQSASRILTRIAEAPKLEFKADDPSANQKLLEQLVRWFHAQSAKPECYAAMIPTMDDGPFQGLPHDAKAPLEAQHTNVLDAKQKLEVRLCKTDRAKEPWALQGVRGGKLLWSRIVSGAPDESVTQVELSGEAKPLGTYGWVVPMSVQWSQGHEQAYLYVDAKGGFLFYFLSW